MFEHKDPDAQVMMRRTDSAESTRRWAVRYKSVEYLCGTGIPELALNLMFVIKDTSFGKYERK